MELLFLAMWVVVSIVAYLLGRSFPNGKPVLWAHAMQFETWYRVCKVVLENADHKVFCAVLRIETNIYSSIYVYLPPVKDCLVEEGDYVKKIQKESKWIMEVRGKPALMPIE